MTSGPGGLTPLIQTDPFISPVGARPPADAPRALVASPKPIFQDEGEARCGGIPGASKVPWSGQLGPPQSPPAPFSNRAGGKEEVSAAPGKSKPARGPVER